jgi:serine/alanine adding enzyme
MLIKTNTEIDRNSWQALLDSSEFSSPFQTPAFYDFFNSLDDFSADVFAVEEGGELSSLMVVTIQKEKGIKGYFSRRGIIYGGPLECDKNGNSLQFLLKSVIKHYSGKLIYLEVRNYFDYSFYNESIKNSGFEFIPWLNFHLDVSTTDQMLKAMSSSRSRQIKKVIKSGVKWQIAQSEKEVMDFYEILEDLYVNKIKKPLFPKQFFLEFYRQNIGKYFLVYFEDKIIGGIMSPVMEGRVIYEFYVCGLDSEYKEQYPSVMATWAAMDYASQNNIPLFDFMGAGNPAEEYGVREFKSRFGGRQVEHGRYLKVINPLLYKVGIIGLKVLSKIKK